MSENIHRYTTDEISKLGHTLIYLSQKVGFITKTKALKLLYFLDEISIKKYGIPFIGLTYEVWQFGPVAQDVFIDLSDNPVMLKDYISIQKEFVHGLNNEVTVIEPLIDFSDDEFSDNDLEVLNYVIKHFGKLSAFDLSEITHNSTSLWFKNAKENNLLESFNNGLLNSSNFLIDFTLLLDPYKTEIYKNYMETKQLERGFNI
ncbi:MAG: hypothetical protein CVU08_11375 [Bacteroidetes bacterium HGW-Bacteroidetes-3]|jgi:uncharacterized phage-associated protein|nr:MAG: hypothetical protein CVU08_11375 [Bacteroidetes bacterium HGW-Bacteroidetes-3]